MRRKKDVKLEDIAKELSVSIVSVSNALKGKKGISQELLDRVVETAAKMGYQI
jgi:DNA-binding LacI/PurR family transcriptional regulator